jgi:hypothetical protein
MEWASQLYNCEHGLTQPVPAVHHLLWSAAVFPQHSESIAGMQKHAVAAHGEWWSTGTGIAMLPAGATQQVATW